jgi:YD repeat-containing protein
LYFDEYLARVGPERLWVAEHTGQAVLLVESIVDGREAKVEPIVVASAQRGGGIGQAPLEHVVEEARGLGIRYLSVRPVARNLEAIAFDYDSGFRALGEIDVHGSGSAAAWHLETWPRSDATTRYTYDVEGRLVQVIDAKGHVTNISYDSLGRKTAMTDPDLGAYNYDDNDNLLTQPDAWARVRPIHDSAALRNAVSIADLVSFPVGAGEGSLAGRDRARAG